MIGVYMITNLVNGKRYIGQSWDIHRRWQDERSCCHNKHLKAAFKKYGIDNFEFRVLAEADNQQRLDDLEMAYIDILDTADPAKGYNKTLGGSTGHKPSAETRRKISESMKGKNKGKKHTEKTKQVIREANLGRKMSKEATQKRVAAWKATRARMYSKGEDQC